MLKKSFWEGISSTNFTTNDIILVLLIAGLLGLYIYGIYRVTARKAFYSKSFNTSLVIMTLITAAIIVTIQSSVVISLGDVVRACTKHYKIKSRNMTKQGLDLVIELRIKDGGEVTF